MPPPAAPADEPADSGWDAAPQLSNGAASPVAEAARSVSAATPPRAVSASDLAPLARAARASAELSPAARAPSSPQLEARAAPAPAKLAGASPTPVEPSAAAFVAAAPGAGDGLPPAVQEQLLGVLRAALDATLVPLLEKQAELEAKLEALAQADKRAPMPSIPVLIGPSTAPPPGSMRPPPLVLDLPSGQPSPSVAPPGASPTSSPPRRASLVPTSYGFVIAPDAPLPRPSIELALENVGPIDVPDFGRRRRAAGTVLVGLLLAGLFAAVAATVLSYT